MCAVDRFEGGPHDQRRRIDHAARQAAATGLRALRRRARRGGLLAVATPASAQSTGVCAVLDGIDQLNDGFFGAGSGLGADGALGELHRTLAGIPIAGAVLRAVVAAIDGCDV